MEPPKIPARADWEQKFESRIPTDDEWEKQRGIITQLYLSDSPKRKLEDVRQIMVEEHGFYANDTQYKERIKKWDIGKNLKKQTVLAMLKIQEKRALEGKSTGFTYNGLPVEEEKLERSRKRHKSDLDTQISQLAVTPPLVEYKTPSPKGQNEIPNEDNNQGGGTTHTTTATEDNPLERRFIYQGSATSNEDSPSDRLSRSRKGSNTEDEITATNDNSLERFIYLGSHDCVSVYALENWRYPDLRIPLVGKIWRPGAEGSSGEKTSDTVKHQDLDPITESITELLTIFASKPRHTYIGAPLEWDELGLGASAMNGVSQNLRGSVWMSSGWGGKSVIGSWIEDDIVMSGKQPFGTDSQSVHSSQSKHGIHIGVCCGTEFFSAGDLFRHYEENHRWQTETKPRDRAELVEGVKGSGDKCERGTTYGMEPLGGLR